MKMKADVGPAKKAEDFKKQLSTIFTNRRTNALQYYPATNDSVANISQLIFPVI
jgi:hypothetical protein